MGFIGSKNQRDNVNGNISFYSEFDWIEKYECKKVDILYNLSHEVTFQYYFI